MGLRGQEESFESPTARVFRFVPSVGMVLGGYALLFLLVDGIALLVSGARKRWQLHGEARRTPGPDTLAQGTRTDTQRRA
jgi:hypothetical protein